MNLSKLFNAQIPLRQRIIKKHSLENQSLLENFILALNVEIAELANEWQGFKHWKVDPQPKEGMLEEYADGLSFILELGLELGVTPKEVHPAKCGTILKQFNEIYYCCADIGYCHQKGYDASAPYYFLFENFLGLGEMLGFSEKDIEQAYYEKNAINHKRQEAGY